jgi:hypothetical protein
MYQSCAVDKSWRQRGAVSAGAALRLLVLLLVVAPRR